MGKLLKKPQFYIFLLTIVLFSAMGFYYSQSSRQIEVVQAQDAVYYVTQSGSGNHNGSSYAHAWSVADWSLQRLENNHSADTIYFCGNISDEVKVRWGGSAAGYITYEGGGDGGLCTAATVDRDYDGDDYRFAIAARDQVENISYYTLQNFTLKNVGGGPLQWNNHCVWLVDGDSHHVIIDNVHCLDDKGTLRQKAAGFEIIGLDYLQIKNSTVTDMGIGISLRKVNYYYLYNNTIIRPNYCSDTDCRHGTGIAIGSVGGVGDQNDYGRILENTVQGYYADTNTHTGVGIQIARGSHILLKGNTLFNNGQPGHQFEGYDCGVDNLRYLVAEDNVYYDNGQRFGGWETGAWIDEAQDVVFQRNRLYSNNLGVNITQNEHVIFRYNLIYNTNNIVSGQYETQGNSISGKAELDCSVDDPSYGKLFGADYMLYNNTFYNNGKSNSWRGEFYLNGEKTAGADMKNPVVFKNNIVANSQHDYLVQWEDSQTGAPIFDYNYYFREPGKSYVGCDIDVGGVVCSGDQSKLTWSEWTSDEGQDQHSVYSESVPPLFVDETSGNFAPQSDSLVIDKGTFLTQASGSGTGRSFVVDDARYFAGNMGIVDGTGWAYTGDVIMVGNDQVTVESVDYSSNTITTEESFSWANGENVYLKSDFVGNSISGIPDIGAYEYQSENQTCLPADLDCSTSVGVSDLTQLKDLWGQSGKADLNQDSITNVSDLGIMMSTWGNY